MAKTRTVTGTTKADAIVVTGSYATVNKKKKTSIYASNVTVKAGKGNDTITINAGGIAKAPNKLYGGAGNDVFAISKKSTGIATVVDFASKEKVKVNGNTSKIYVSGKNMVIKGGKGGKATLTLKNAKGKTFTVTDSRGSYSVKSSNVTLTLAKYFKGTLTSPSFITNIDARKLELEKNAYGSEIQREVNITGNTKANTVYVAKINGGTYQGGKGNDTIIVSEGNNHIVYGDDKAGKITGRNSINKDTITIKGGTGHTIYGGTGTDTIIVEQGIDRSDFTINGEDGDDVINIKSGGGVYYNHTTISGGAGNDQITLFSTIKNNFTVNGGSNDDRIKVYGGSDITINGDAGTDYINLYNGTGSSIPVNGGSEKDYIIAEGGSGTINGDDGDDEITLQKNAGDFTINGGNGKDIITIKAGNYNTLNGGNNDDSIMVESGGTQYYRKILGGAGNDIITISGGNSHNVYGDAEDDTYEGHDTITVKAGSGHTIYCGKGKDIITLSGGSSTVYGQAGADVFTVTGGNHTIDGGDGLNTYNIKSGTNSITIKGGSDKDTVNIYAGNVENINAGGGNDNITLAGGSGYGDNYSRSINGGDGQDTIKVTGGESFKINGGSATDTIIVNAGSNHWIYNDGGDDTITINAGAGDKIHINGCNAGGETVKIYGGDNHDLSLGDGDNTVLVTGGKNHTITTGSNKDTITVQNGVHVTDVDTGKGNDTVTVKSGAYVDNGSPTNYYKAIRTGDGDDKIYIEANAGDGTTVSGGSDNDEIYIRGGNNHTIYTDAGSDILEITGGKGHTIYLGSGENKVTAAVNKTILHTASNSVDKITINWDNTKEIGTSTIYTQSGESVTLDDKLIINNAVINDFKFTLEGGYNKNLVLSSGDGNYLVIDSWLRANNTIQCSFKGITIGGTNYTAEDINNNWLQ